MITAIVSAIESPISLVVSGWLGESGMWQMWPTQVIMLSSDVSWKLPSILWCVRILIFLYYSGTLCRVMVS